MSTFAVELRDINIPSLLLECIGKFRAEWDGVNESQHTSASERLVGSGGVMAGAMCTRPGPSIRMQVLSLLVTNHRHDPCDSGLTLLATSSVPALYFTWQIVLETTKGSWLGFNHTLTSLPGEKTQRTLNYPHPHVYGCYRT